MINSTVLPRRWFRFSLRMMFVVVTVVSLGCAWLGWNVKIVRQRAAILPGLQSDVKDKVVFTSQVFLPHRRASDLTTGKLPWLWRQLGAQPEKRVYTREGEMSDAEVARVQSLFPEAEIWEYPRGSLRDPDRIRTLRAVLRAER